MPDAVPRLRPEIDAAPASRNGESFYILYDRSGVSSSRLLISPLGLLIAGRLDGSSSILDISDSLGREAPGEAGCREVEMVVDALERAMFLEGTRFQDFAAQTERDFLACPIRRAGQAGSAYSDDPIRLSECLDRIIREAPEPEEAPLFRDRPRGVVAPHLDFFRGAPGYGQAYRLLAGFPPPDTVVALGTAHTPLRERFSLCDKDFDTPLGLVRIDRGLTERLRRAVKPHGDVDRDVLAHRAEHSLELQAVWLRHVYGDGFSLAPLLVSPMTEFMDGSRDPGEAASDPAFRAVGDCLAAAAADGRTLIMASADLSHVGSRFGDARELSGSYLAEVEEADRSYLAAAASDPVEGLAFLASQRDRRHVCGAAPLFALGLSLAGAKASLLGYHQAVTPEMREAVTCAAMAFR